MIKQYMPVRLFTGKGCVAANADVFGKFGKRCLIVTGASSAKASGALADIVQVLNKNSVSFTVYDGIKQNPTVESCIEASAAPADFIIGIGGGSVLDAAKAISVFSANPGLNEDLFYKKEWIRKPLPVILAGTTAGTGSEVTKVAVLTDSRGRKHSIHDDMLYAGYAFGDPSYLGSVSAMTALYTAADVLMHAIESRFSTKADAYSRLCSEAAVRAVLRPLNLMAAGEAGLSDFAETVYEASIFAGLAINSTGTCFPHNVGYFLTENLGLPHGAACAVFLPEFIEHVSRAVPEDYEGFLSSANTTTEELLFSSDIIIKKVPASLTEAEIDAALPRWKDNGSVRNTVGTVSLDYIKTSLMKFAKEN